VCCLVGLLEQVGLAGPLPAKVKSPSSTLHSTTTLWPPVVAWHAKVPAQAAGEDLPAAAAAAPPAAAVNCISTSKGRGPTTMHFDTFPERSLLRELLTTTYRRGSSSSSMGRKPSKFDTTTLPQLHNLGLSNTRNLEKKEFGHVKLT
jgi:hypothetical protein